MLTIILICVVTAVVPVAVLSYIGGRRDENLPYPD